MERPFFFSFFFISFLHGKKDSMAASSLKMQTYADLLDDRSLLLYSLFFFFPLRLVLPDASRFHSNEKQKKRKKKKDSLCFAGSRDLQLSLAAVPCRLFFFFFSLSLSLSLASATHRKRCEGSLHASRFFFFLLQRITVCCGSELAACPTGRKKKRSRCSEKTLRPVFLCGVLHAR